MKRQPQRCATHEATQSNGGKLTDTVAPSQHRQRLLHTIKRLRQHHTRAGEIEADKTLATGAKRPAIVHRNLRLAEKKRKRIVVRYATLPAIEPR